MQKHFMKIAAVLSLSVLAFFFGCSNILSNSENDSVEYGGTSLYEKYGWQFVSEIDTYLPEQRMQRLYRLSIN